MVWFPKCLFVFCNKYELQLIHCGEVFAEDTKKHVFAEVRKCPHCSRIISRPMTKQEFSEKKESGFWKLRG